MKETGKTYPFSDRPEYWYEVDTNDGNTVFFVARDASEARDARQDEIDNREYKPLKITAVRRGRRKA